MNERIEQFLRVMRAASIQRPSGANHRAADKWLSDFQRDFPLATPAEQELVQAEIRNACGINGQER